MRTHVTQRTQAHVRAPLAPQIVGYQLALLRCGWTTVDFVGQVHDCPGPRHRRLPAPTCHSAGWEHSNTRSRNRSRAFASSQVMLSSGESNTVTITGKVLRRALRLPSITLKCPRSTPQYPS